MSLPQWQGLFGDYEENKKCALNDMMRNLVTSLLFACCMLQVFSSAAQKPGRSILVFSKTAGYQHKSIPAAVAAIQKLGKEQHIEVDTSSRSEVFTENNLKKYAAVVFVSPSGDALDTSQQADFERYIQAGGGYVGIHGATTLEYNWPWYGKLAGAFFDGHPKPQHGVITVVDSVHPATRHLPRPWKWFDEWYNFKDMVKDVHVLLAVDETTYEGGKLGAWHPIAWYHEFDGGRAFYTALGHFDAAYSEPLFLQHLLAGIQYAMGNNIVLDYKKARTKRIQ
jgi:type 1 glutamine amidotransferase